MPTLSRNIIISIVLAVAAAAAILAYTSSVRSSADEGSNAVEVIVATHEVPSGTNVDDAQARGWLSIEPVRQVDIANGAVSDFSAVTGQVITQPLYEGDQLTTFRIGEPRSQTAAGQVTGNFRAIRVPLNPNSGLLRDLQTDDRVDVITSYRRGDTTMTYLAVPNALVLSVDTPDNDGSFSSTASGNAGSVLLSITEEQSLIIANALASSNGANGGTNIWLVAVGRSGATYESTRPVELPGAFPNHGVPVK
jgi:Flp pilus assembly protein CpaB